MPLFADPGPADWMPFTQLGCLGLLAMGFIWFFWKGAPLLMQKHQEIVNAITENAKATITKLVDDFKVEAGQCREERLESQKQFAEEREKDRAVRHATNNVLQQMQGALETLTEKIG